MIPKPKLYLCTLSLFILIVATACQSEIKLLVNTATPEALNNKPIIIAQGTVVIKGDGSKQTIKIWMVDGKEVYDPEPGAFQGTFLNGTFEVVATDQGGKELARLGLNDAFDGGVMSFRKELPFELKFDDYNEDGQPDFTVGQWGGSNGNFYSLFTIGSNGFRVLEQNIYSANHYPSIRYRKLAGKAFLNKYYDQMTGSYMDIIHRWKDGVFIKETPNVSKEAGAAGV